MKMTNHRKPNSGEDLYEFERSMGRGDPRYNTSYARLCIDFGKHEPTNTYWHAWHTDTNKPPLKPELGRV